MPASSMVADMLSGQPKRSGMQTAGRALSGFSAGLSGQGPQYLQSLAAQDQAKAKEQQALSAERLKAMAMDAQRVSSLLESGDVNGALRVVDNRTQAIKQLGGDASDTLRIRQLITAGAIPAAQAELGQFLSAAKQYGLIPQPEIIPQSAISPTGQVGMRDPSGNMSMQNIPGFQAPVAEGYEIISPEEAARMNLPPDKQFQRNKQTNQISQIGGTGTTVNLNTADMSPGQKKVDESFATETYLPWITGGGADSVGQIATLMPVIDSLEKNEPITGPVMARLPDWYKSLTPAGVASIDAKNLVQQVVQRNLRTILGAQFTAQEGENLIQRAYNDALPPEKNLPRVRRLLEAMQQAAEAKNKMVQYFEENGSLKGYRGKLPSLDDFYQAVGQEDAAAAVDDPLGLFPERRQ